MSPALAQLVRTIPPPFASGGNAINWEAAERQISYQLPADYKKLVELYGSGSFNSFISVHQPLHKNRFLDLAERWQEEMNAFRYVRAYGERVPYNIEAGHEELISLGDNGQR